MLRCRSLRRCRALILDPRQQPAPGFGECQHAVALQLCGKRIVIDAFVKVSLVGIELLSIEARVVIASVETYLKYAEAIGLTASAASPA